MVKSKLSVLTELELMKKATGLWPKVKSPLRLTVRIC